jgi:hypothetical protein
MDEEFVLVAAPSWAERVDPARVAAEGPAALHGAPLVTTPRICPSPGATGGTCSAYG